MSSSVVLMSKDAAEARKLAERYAAEVAKVRAENARLLEENKRLLDALTRARGGSVA